MVTVAKDVRWPFVGEKVTLRASGLSGNRARFKLTAKPQASKLELFDAGREDYLEAAGDYRATIAPDVPGYYTITAVDEQVSSNVKHYSNDGGAGLSKGLVSATTLASAVSTIAVGTVMRCTLGTTADPVDLTVRAHASGSWSGVMTYYSGEAYGPKLTASTDKGKLAVACTAVTAALAYYGGYGYPGASPVLLWSAWSEDPADLYARLALGFSLHLGYLANQVHDAVDATNSMAAVAAPTTEPTLVTYTNTMRGKVIAHFALGVGAAHPHGADVTNTLGAACTDLASARTLLLDIRSTVGAHQILHTSEAHNAPGDATVDSLMPYQLIQSNEATAACCTYASTIAAAWDEHLPLATIAVAYHAATGSVNAPQLQTPNDLPDLIAKVNDLASRLEAHAQNRNLDTGSAASYHTVKDLGCVIPTRANDSKSVVETLHHALWAYQHHTLRGDATSATWHGGSINNAGAACVEADGAPARIQLGLLSSLKGEDLSTPPNTIAAVDQLVRLGGFTSP